MVDRNVKRLTELGIVIEISRTRTPISTLGGGGPVFDTTDLHSRARIQCFWLKSTQPPPVQPAGHAQLPEAMLSLALLEGAVEAHEITPVNGPR
jgi:hypothetical protein